jgi:hypothetical protein
MFDLAATAPGAPNVEKPDLALQILDPQCLRLHIEHIQYFENFARCGLINQRRGYLTRVSV